MKINYKASIYTSLFFILMFSLTDLIAQQQEWEIDKIEKRAQAKKQILDSSLVHLENKWSIKVAHGRWFFTQPRIDEPARFPKSMGVWQITGAWHFKERWLAELAVGIQLKRDIPTRPNIGAILSGSNINIEGSGGAIMPISVGLKYYFTEKRFRPLIGISSGVAPVTFRSIFAEGNITDGIERTEDERNNRTLFGNINMGFDYRLSEKFGFSMNAAYHFSPTFSEPIGGYSKFEGLLINTGITIIF